MKINWKDLLARAAWTFFEGFIVALPTTITLDMDGATWKTILFSAALAGVSAVKSFILEFVRYRQSKVQDGFEQLTIDDTNKDK